jgi:site-specific DNA recombinase
VQQPTTDDPNGRLMERMFEVFDQHESEMNGVRTSAAMRQNAQRGYFNGSNAPFGFGVEKVGLARGQTKRRLVSKPTEADVVRSVFQMYVAGSGAKNVARDLNIRGLRFRGRPWNRDKVLGVIGETAAIGAYYWGKGDTRNGTVRDKDEWILMTVEPIVEPELFEFAQRVRADRDPVRNPGRASSRPLLLAGLIECGVCGGNAQLESSGKAPAEGKAPYRYYNCRAFCRSGKELCVGFRIKTETIERAVVEHVATRMFTDEYCREVLRDVVEEQGVLRKKAEQAKRSLQQRLAEVERRLNGWYEKIEAKADLEDIGLDRLRQLKVKRDELAREISSLPAIQAVPPHLYKPETVQRFRDRLKAALVSNDHDVTRPSLRQLLDRIVVGPDEVIIEAKAEAVVALMASGGQAPELKNAASGGFLTDVVGWRTPVDSNH